jgi:hypothetical protein
MWQMEDSTPRLYTYFQFGLQRTGTTIVDRMIRDNWGFWKANDHEDYKPRPYTPQPQEQSIWKHMIDMPSRFEAGSPTVLVYKNPYTWAESMAFRNGMGNGAWNTSWGHENLNLYPQPRPGWNNISVPGQGLCNIGHIMYVYQHWFNTWLPYAEQNPDTTVLIKYEDLLVAPSRKRIFDEIADKFGWPRIDEGNLVMANHVGSSQPMDAERTKYYIQGRPTDERFYKHGTRYIQSINDILGRDFIASLGYEII